MSPDSVNLCDSISIPAEVMARQVGDETVILDLASGTYFGLDCMGSHIWQLIGTGREVAEIRNILLAEYEVSSEVLDRDLLALLRELNSLGLIGKG